MLYKYSFSILYGHLNFNQKRKKNWILPVTSQTDQLPVKPTGYQSNRLVYRPNRPVYRSNRPVYWYEPVELRILNSNLNSTGTDRFLAKPDRYTGTGPGDLAGPVAKWNPGHDGAGESCRLPELTERGEWPATRGGCYYKRAKSWRARTRCRAPAYRLLALLRSSYHESIGEREEHMEVASGNLGSRSRILSLDTNILRKLSALNVHSWMFTPKNKTNPTT